MNVINYVNDNDHVVWNDAARQVSYVLVSGVNDLCQFLAVKQLLFHPDWHVLHEYRMLDHIAADNLRYHRAPVTHRYIRIYIQSQTHTHTTYQHCRRSQNVNTKSKSATLPGIKFCYCKPKIQEQ